MTNWEKYKDEILKIAAYSGFTVVNEKPEPCCCTDCTECGFVDNDGTVSCEKARLKWLDEEYKEPSSYSDWEIDDKIKVSLGGKNWLKRYFAGISENGKPMAWNNGATSWSCNGREVWNYARKVEE